jgi:ribose 5-phosphate isomerase RpiB
MRIAVVSEVSAVDRNPDLVASLEGRGHEVINAGMSGKGDKPELLYVHTGFLAALLLHACRVDFVVGGCGTGQGFLNSAMQYPGVFCGLLLGPLDAWLFSRINAGNCVSLPLNQGYGWAADVNLRLLFDSLFGPDRGAGYPAHRSEVQAGARALLGRISSATHRGFAEIVRALPDEVLAPAVEQLRARRLLDLESLADRALREAFAARVGR